MYQLSFLVFVSFIWRSLHFFGKSFLFLLLLSKLFKGVHKSNDMVCLSFFQIQNYFLAFEEPQEHLKSILLECLAVMCGIIYSWKKLPQIPYTFSFCDFNPNKHNIVHCNHFKIWISHLYRFIFDIHWTTYCHNFFFNLFEPVLNQSYILFSVSSRYPQINSDKENNQQKITSTMIKMYLLLKSILIPVKPNNSKCLLLLRSIF